RLPGRPEPGGGRPVPADVVDAVGEPDVDGEDGLGDVGELAGTGTQRLDVRAVGDAHGTSWGRRPSSPDDGRRGQWLRGGRFRFVAVKRAPRSEPRRYRRVAAADGRRGEMRGAHDGDGRAAGGRGRPRARRDGRGGGRAVRRRPRPATRSAGRAGWSTAGGRCPTSASSAPTGASGSLAAARRGPRWAGWPRRGTPSSSRSSSRAWWGSRWSRAWGS